MKRFILWDSRLTVAYYVTLWKRGQWTHITTIHSGKSDNWESCECVGFTLGDEAINRMSTSSELVKSPQWITFSYKSCYWACCVLGAPSRQMGGSMPRVRRRAGLRHRYLDSTRLDYNSRYLYQAHISLTQSGWVKHSFSFSSFYGANSQNEASDRDGVSTLLNLE